MIRHLNERFATCLQIVTTTGFLIGLAASVQSNVEGIAVGAFLLVFGGLASIHYQLKANAPRAGAINTGHLATAAAASGPNDDKPSTWTIRHAGRKSATREE